MPLPDNRIRLPPAPIDFTDDVGTTGQDHDNYPAPNSQPRYDWLRLYLIGLLSCQSSHAEPTQRRDGTPWFDLNTNTLKMWAATAGTASGAWVSIAEVISVGVDQFGNQVTLADAFATIQPLLMARPTATFSGLVQTPGATLIPIPTALRSSAGSGSRPFVWVNGLLLDPRSCTWQGGSQPTSIGLATPLAAGDKFTVTVMNVADTLFYAPSVVI